MGWETRGLLKPHSLPTLKLPRKIEADPRHQAVEQFLLNNRQPLWEKGTLLVPHLAFSPSLETALIRALDFNHLERGLEHIEETLEREKKGLVALREKQGTSPVNRVSRLLIIANDGTERFYRACETTLLHHSDRLLCLHVDASSTRLAENIFGTDKVLKALLVSDRDVVTHVLFSLIKS